MAWRIDVGTKGNMSWGHDPWYPPGGYGTMPAMQPMFTTTKRWTDYKRLYIPPPPPKKELRKRRKPEVWCYCRSKDDGRLMVECSGRDCPIKWFHGDCVKLDSTRGDWYCADCERRDPKIVFESIAAVIRDRLVDPVARNEERRAVGRALADILYDVGRRGTEPFRAPDRQHLMDIRSPVREVVDFIVNTAVVKNGGEAMRILHEAPSIGAPLSEFDASDVILVSPKGRALRRAPSFYSDVMAEWYDDRVRKADRQAALAAIAAAKVAPRRNSKRKRPPSALAVRPPLPEEPPSLEKAAEHVENFFRFATERHLIRRRRDAGMLWPWTDDDVLMKYRFTNVKRDHDRVTRWLLENWATTFADAPPSVVFLNCAIFRAFGTIAFAEELGWTKSLDDFSVDAIVDAAIRVWRKGFHAFTRAYCRPRFNAEIVSKQKKKAATRKKAPTTAFDQQQQELRCRPRRTCRKRSHQQQDEEDEDDEEPEEEEEEEEDQRGPPAKVYSEAANGVRHLVAALPRIFPDNGDDEDVVTLQEAQEKSVTWQALATFFRTTVKGYGGTGFVVKELMIDARYWPRVRKVVDDPGAWTIAGPGARRGLNRVFDRPRDFGILAPAGSAVEGRFIDEIRLLRAEAQRRHLIQDGNPCPHCGRGLFLNHGTTNETPAGCCLPEMTIHDVQFALCEFDKYRRALGQGSASLARYYPLDDTLPDDKPTDVLSRPRTLEVHVSLRQKDLILDHNGGEVTRKRSRRAPNTNVPATPTS